MFWVSLQLLRKFSLYTACKVIGLFFFQLIASHRMETKKNTWMTKNVWNENEKEEAKDVMKKATKIKLSVCFNGSAEKLVMLNNPRTFDKLLFITLWTYEWCMLITTNSPNGQCHSLIALNVCCVCVQFPLRFLSVAKIFSDKHKLKRISSSSIL